MKIHTQKYRKDFSGVSVAWLQTIQAYTSLSNGSTRMVAFAWVIIVKVESECGFAQTATADIIGIMGFGYDSLSYSVQARQTTQHVCAGLQVL